MKKVRLILAALALGCAAAGAQRTPTHPLDIKDAEGNFAQYLDNWEPGTPPKGVSAIDDEFFIGRVRPLPRISDGDYQVNSSVDKNRKMCLWVPLDDPSVTWKALPRYCFEGDNFSLWSYINIHGNWTAPWFRVTAGLADAAHKNGVEVGCCWAIPHTQQVTTSGSTDNSKAMKKLLEKDADGNFLHTRQLVRLMKYYGIDGIGLNSEFYSNPTTMTLFRDFIKECHQVGEEIGWDFKLYWYDGTSDTGSIRFDYGLASHNQLNFGDKDNRVSDMLFFNYNWTSSLLSSSAKKAEDMGRNPYDIYAGFDIQQYAYKDPPKASWSTLLNSKTSIGFWGAHSQSLIHQSATDDGTSDIAIQKAYLLKQELTFSGGNRNPAVLPEMAWNTTLANASLKKFHGLAHFLTAKSTIQQLPFVTRFNLGNGLKFYNEGKVAFDHKWYNLNTQDFLPTWRWWITDRSDKATTSNLSGLIQAELTFDEAYFGGSCLKVHGATDFSRIKLFKTQLAVEPSHNISLTYKMPGTEATHAKVFVALRGALTRYREVEIPAAAAPGVWQTFTAPLSQLGIESGDQIAMIGLSFDGTPADYNMLVGELAIADPAADYGTVTPTIKEVEIIRGRYNALDFKIRYASREETGDQKTYNDEVGTWYYEIYFQQEGQPQYLLTATTSWAAYAVDVPLVSGFEGRTGRFGVRAVSPDGRHGSDIVWTEYQEIPYNQILTDVVVDKNVVKPGETFTVGLQDIMSDPAKEWRVADPVTGEVVASAQNAVNLQTSIAKEGVYDLYFVDKDGNESVTRGFIQITPEATGAVPTVLTFESDVKETDINKPVHYSYTARKGEGKVSRALRVEDPNMLMVPGEVQKGMAYSYALWFKAEKFSHDKQGTNLINKNTIHDTWPHNNWGDLWVIIRPAIAKGTVFGGHADWAMTKDHPANEISFNTMGWGPRDGPCENVMSSGYQVTEGVWNHVVVTSNGMHHKIYFNGRKVADYTFDSSNEFSPTRRSDMSDSRISRAVADAPIFIGGGNVYKAGFVGWIDEFQVWDKELSDDEVLQAMKGYDAAAVPANLQAYYTFETLEADGTFKNFGKAGDKPAKMVAMVGSGGENTASASYEDRTADNDALGFPGITGSIDITTTSEWQLPGASFAEDDGTEVSVTYPLQGKYDAGVKLSNMWGEGVVNNAEYITVIDYVGIHDFLAGAGEDDVRYFTVDGRRISKADAEKQQVFILQVVKDGKPVRTAKVLR